MTVNEAITYADTIKPNAISQAIKLRWLSQVEGRIAEEIMLMSPAEGKTYFYTADDLGKELLVDHPHDDIYTWWLQAQIDLANEEYDKAQATMDMFNATWAGYLRWFCNLYDPVQGYESEGY